MNGEKSPFVGTHEIYPRRKLKQYRPLSTRPWVLLLFLAATGLCFGCLVAVSLVDRQTSLNTKRDVARLVERDALVRRQVHPPASTVVYTLQAEGRNQVRGGLNRRQSTDSPTTVVYTTLTSDQLSLTDSPTTTEASTITSADLSLTSQSTIATIVGSSSAEAELSLTSSPITSLCVVTVAVTIISYTATVGSGSGAVDATTISSFDDPSTGSCTSVYMTVTSGAILSLTSQDSSTTPKYTYTTTSAVLSLTSQPSTTGAVLSLTSQSTSGAAVSQISDGSVELSLTSPSSATVKLSLTSQTSGGLLTLSSSSTPAANVISASTTPSDPVQPLSVATSATIGLSLTSQGLSLTEGPTTSLPQTSYSLPQATDNTLALTSRTSAWPVSTLSVSKAVTSATGALYNSISSAASSAASILSLSSASTFVSNGITITGQSSSSTTLKGGGIVMIAIVPGTTIDGSVLASTTLTITTVPATGSVSSVVTLTAAIVPIETAGLSVIYGASIPGITMAGTTVAPTTAASFAVGMHAASLTGTNSPSSTSSGTPVDPTINADLVLLKIDFHNYDYFLAMYLPKIIAVILGCVWSIIFATLKLMEPFYQLSAHSGAFAKEAFFGNYLSSEILPSSLTAMFRGQWVLILGGTCLLGWAAVIALCSEAMLVISKGTCKDAEGKDFRCDPGWAVDLPILKTLMVLIGLIFALTFVITWIMFRRRRTGVYADPSSIVSMTELLGYPDVIQEFREIDPLSTNKEIQTMLAENRYKLGFYDSTTGKEMHEEFDEHSNQRYGLIKISGGTAPQAYLGGSRISYGSLPNTNVRTHDPAKINKKRRLYQGIFDSVMLLTEITLFGIVLGYYLDGKSDPFNDFFNGNNFGPRFVLTCLGLILSAGWRTTSQEVTLMAPYRNMAKAYHNGTGAPAQRSILAATACTPFTAFSKGIVLRNYLIAATALSAVLSEVLVVAVSGVPFTAGQIKPSLQASSFTSLGILFIMAVNTVAIMIHKRTSAGGTRRLPRQPDTLINVWLYLCDSTLVQHEHDEVDTGSNRPLDQAGLTTKYSGCNYAFARVLGTDSVPRWIVDHTSELQKNRTSISQQRPYQLDWPLPAAERPVSSTPSVYSQDSQVIPRNAHEVAAQRQATTRQQQQLRQTRQRDFIPPPTTRTYSIDRSYYAEAPEYSTTPLSEEPRRQRQRTANFSVLGKYNERQGYRVVLPSTNLQEEVPEDERADLGTSRLAY